MENLIIALVVPFVSALAYVAYMHHQSFPKIERVMRWASIVIITALNIFQAGTTVGRTWVIEEVGLSKTIPPAQKIAVLEVVTSAGKHNDLPMFKITIIYAAFAAYMIILVNLPKLLDLNSKGGKTK